METRRRCRGCGQHLPAHFNAPNVVGSCPLCQTPVPSQASSARLPTESSSSSSDIDLTLKQAQAANNGANHQELARLSREALEADPLLALHSELSFVQKATLGTGGMGVVYEVIDKRLGRTAALKLLHEDKRHMGERFLREARITAALDHPAIPPVYELGKTLDGQIYLVMKRIRGRTLQQAIQQYHAYDQEPSALRTLLEALVKVCEALAFAHSQNIVHRDLKPQNIMVGEFGEVLVLDWGLAKDLSNQEPELKLDKDSPLKSETNITQAGSVLGTLGYMAPEQAEGGELDARADVFALGAILTRILTDRVPIEGKTNINRLNATLKRQICHPLDYDPNVPAELNSIAAQALHPDHLLRTDSALTVLTQVRAYLAGEAVPGHEYSLLAKSLRTISRHPSRLLGATALLVTATLILTMYSQLESLRRKAAIDRLKSTSKISQAQTEARKAREITALLEEARSLAKRKVKKSLIRLKIEEALLLSEGALSHYLACSEICEKAGLKDTQRELLQKAHKQYPESYPVMYALHRLDLDAQWAQGVLYSKWFRKIIATAEKRGDENEFVLFAKGQALLSKKKYQEALSCFNKIEDYTKNFVFLYNERGVTYKKLGQIDKAVADFRHAIDLAPEFSRPYVNLGQYYMDRGQWSKAIELLNKALTLNAELPTAYASRARAYQSLNRHEEALKDFERIISSPRVKAEDYRDRGLVYLEMGDIEKALADFDKTMAMGLKSSYVYKYRARCHGRLKNKDDCLADFAKSLKMNPEDGDCWAFRGHFQLMFGDNQQAIEDCSEALKYLPCYHYAFFHRGLAHDRLGHKKQAIEDYSQAIKNYQGLTSALCNRGNLYADLGQLQAAVRDFNEALKYEPKHWHSYLGRGRCYYSSQPRRAIADFSQVLKYNPKNYESLYLRSKLYQRLNKAKLAIEGYEALLRADPKNKLAPKLRAWIKELRGQ